MIVIVATMKAKEGQEMELEEILKGMIANVQPEEGVRMYTLHRAKDDPGKFLFYEMYKDKVALDFHGSQPYFKDFGRNISGLVVERPKIDVYEDIISIKR